MISSNLYALVMAGGHGTRFWPVSTREKPKQYLNLIGERSLLAQTYQRFEGLVTKERRFLVTTKVQARLALESAGDWIDESRIILEPAGRNTAPCILLSLAHLVENGARDEDVIAVVPSDHAITDHQAFQATLHHAFQMAVTTENLVTIGIRPHCAHTGYGYIHRGQEISEETYQVQAFREKPSFDKAQAYFESGEYYWNAGMFVSRVDVFLEQFKEWSPEIFAHFYELRQNLTDSAKTAEIYQKLEKISIDYAVMEKSPKILVVPARFDWSDLGSWDALEELYRKLHPDCGDNLELKAIGSFFKSAKGNMIWAPEHVVAVVGVENVVVVVHEGKVLVINKEHAQEVKDAVDYFSTHPKLKDFV